MSILWFGGEDVDFPNGAAPVNNGAGYFRVGYARSAVSSANTSSIIRSAAFPGGAVTSCWFTYRMLNNGQTAGGLHLGLVKDPTTNAGLYIGAAAASGTRLALVSYDGTTKHELATESGNTLTTSPIHRVDVQLVNYGVSATVNVFVDQVFVLNFSGDVTVSGVTSLSAVATCGSSTGFGFSEIVVSDLDTRPLVGVLTLALTGAGTTANWSNNTFTNINAAVFSDASPVFSNTNNQVQDYNVTDLPAGIIVDVLATKITTRMAKSSAPAVSQVQLGYNNGAGTSGAGTGATKAPITSYASYEQYDATNPITSAGWVQADINALQLELTAKT